MEFEQPIAYASAAARGQSDQRSELSYCSSRCQYSGVKRFFLRRYKLRIIISAYLTT